MVHRRNVQVASASGTAGSARGHWRIALGGLRIGLMSAFVATLITPMDAASQSSERGEPIDSAQGWLRMDFEGDLTVVESASGQGARFVQKGQPWQPQAGGMARAGAPLLGVPEIQFQGGDASQRHARVVDDTGRAGNRVLEFVLRQANVPLRDRAGFKSRIQMNVYGNVGVGEVYQSVRLRLESGFADLGDLPDAFDWFTISEWWNNAGWTNEPHPFRISVHISKLRSGKSQPLNFAVAATAKPPGGDKWRIKVWNAAAEGFAVPVGQWMRLEYYYRDGGRDDGRFAMAVTPDGGERRVLFDVTGYTRHPGARASDGLAHWNPIKLYTSDALTQFVRSRGKEFTMHWDDLQILPCGADMPAGSSPCARAFGCKRPANPS